MSKIRPFRTYIINDQPTFKRWQEIRDGRTIMTYTAAYDGTSWSLYSKLSTRKGEGENGDLMRTFADLNALYAFLGVPVTNEVD